MVMLELQPYIHLCTLRFIHCVRKLCALYTAIGAIAFAMNEIYVQRPFNDMFYTFTVFSFYETNENKNEHTMYILMSRYMLRCR